MIFEDFYRKYLIFNIGCVILKTIFNIGSETVNTFGFGQRVKLARKNKRMTQTELATAIGKKEATIRKYENGTIEPPWKIIEQIASVLDVSPFDLTVDVDQLRADVKLQEEVKKAFGIDALVLLNNFDQLNHEGQRKASEYVSDLTEQPKYKKEPTPDTADDGSDD